MLLLVIAMHAAPFAALALLLWVLDRRDRSGRIR